MGNGNTEAAVPNQLLSWLVCKWVLMACVCVNLLVKGFICMEVSEEKGG